MAFLSVERFSLDSGKIDFSKQLASLSIICLKVSQVDFPNKCVLQSLCIAFIIANIANPDEMQQTTKLHSGKFNRVMPLCLKPLGLEL